PLAAALLVAAALGVRLAERALGLGRALAPPGCRPPAARRAAPAPDRGPVAPRARHGEPEPGAALRRALHRPRGAALAAPREPGGQAPARRRPPLAQPVGPRPPALPAGAGEGAQQHLGAAQPGGLLLLQARVR